MAVNAPYYTKTQVDSKIDPLKVDVENIKQDINDINQDVSNLQLEVDGIADGTGGKGYATISDAMAVTPLPADGVLFTIDYDNEAERGVYRYDSTVTPEGYAFVRPIDAAGVIEEGNTEAVSGGEVYKEFKPFYENVMSITDGEINIDLTKTLGYYNSVGTFLEATSVNSTQLIPVNIGDVFIISGITASANQALISKFDLSSTWIGREFVGIASTTTNYTDQIWTSDFDGFISVLGAVNEGVGNLSIVKLQSKIVNTNFFNKTESDERYASKSTEILTQEISNDFYTDVEVIAELDLTINPSSYYSSYNGAIVSNTDWKCAEINVLEGEKYLISGACRPTSTQLIALFNLSTFVGSVEQGNGSQRIFTDYEYIIPSGVTKIGVTSLTSQPLKIKKVTEKKEVDFVKKSDIALKEYGVVIDLSNPTSVELTKIKDSVGLEIKSQKQEIPFTGDDTYKAFPLNEIRDCNILIDDFGATKITYKGEDGFDPVNEVYVEIPLFYMKRYREDNLEYNLISNYQGDGYFPAPMFVENGKILDKVYIGKYENSLTIDGKVVSSSGKRVLFEKTLQENRDLIYAKGRGFAPWDYRLIHSLQHLYLVFFANKNSQNLVGGGWTGLHQPWGTYSTIQNPAGTYTEIIVPYSASYHTQYYFIGQDVGIIDNVDPLHPMVYRRVLVDLKLNFPEAGKTTLVLDEAVTIDPAIHLIGGAPQKTGWSDVLEHHTGRTTLKTSRAGTCAVKLFGIENVWGNVWTQVDGAYITMQRIKISHDITNFNNLGTDYKPLSYILPIQDNLGIPGDQFGSILNLGIDNANPWVRFAESFGGDANQNNSYGDWYYQYNLAGPYMGGFGGGFDHYERAGLFCDRHWYLYNNTWYLIGSRTQFKMI